MSKLHDFPRLRLKRVSTDGVIYWQASLYFAADDIESSDVLAMTLEEAKTRCLRTFKGLLTLSLIHI